MDVLIYAEILFMIGLILLSICNWLMASWVADWIIDKLENVFFDDDEPEDEKPKFNPKNYGGKIL